jgi:hypothetical protein
VSLNPPFFGPAPSDLCGFAQGPSVICGVPARWHIIWNTRLEHGAACEVHGHTVRANWVYFGMHEHETACREGSYYDDIEDRCVVGDALGAVIAELSHEMETV